MEFLLVLLPVMLTRDWGKPKSARRRSQSRHGRASHMAGVRARPRRRERSLRSLALINASCRHRCQILFRRGPEVDMRAAVLLTIFASTLSLIAVTADAKTKHHRSSAHHAPIARPMPAGEPYAARQAGRPVWARPGECLTDEGGGRFNL